MGRSIHLNLSDQLQAFVRNTSTRLGQSQAEFIRRSLEERLRDLDPVPRRGKQLAHSGANGVVYTVPGIQGEGHESGEAQPGDLVHLVGRFPGNQEQMLWPADAPDWSYWDGHRWVPCARVGA
jgi:hypothetical protein